MTFVEQVIVYASTLGNEAFRRGEILQFPDAVTKLCPHQEMIIDDWIELTIKLQERCLYVIC